MSPDYGTSYVLKDRNRNSRMKIPIAKPFLLLATITLFAPGGAIAATAQDRALPIATPQPVSTGLSSQPTSSAMSSQLPSLHGIGKNLVDQFL